MKDNKRRILLIYIFRVIRVINLSKFALISQIFLKFHQFLVFSSFFAKCGCYMVFFRELEPIPIISVQRVTLGWISGLYGAKIDQKFAENCNAITSKVFGIFLWNKKQWKADKIVFLIIYTFIYFKENVFPKYALIFQI